MRLVSTFVYLKVRKFENPAMHVNGIARSPLSYQDEYYRDNTRDPTPKFVPNPNYEQNLLSYNPAGRETIESGSDATQSAGKTITRLQMF